MYYKPISFDCIAFFVSSVIVTVIVIVGTSTYKDSMYGGSHIRDKFSQLVYIYRSVQIIHSDVCQNHCIT